MLGNRKIDLRLAALPILLLALAMLPFGCRREGGQTSRLYHEFGRDMADSLSAGRIAGALRLVERQMAEAGEDSDKFYTALCKRMIVDYYMGNADRLLPGTDSVLRYMLKREPSLERDFVIGKAYSTRAGFYTRFSYNPDSNIYYYTRALDYLGHADEPGAVSDALFNLGGAYKNNGRPDKGADFFGRAIQVVDSAGLPDSYRIPLYSGLASAYSALFDFEQSDKWWKRTARYWDHMTVDDRFHYLNNRGNDLYMQHKYSEALSYFKRLDSLLAKNPDLEWERNFCRANLNDVYLRLGYTDSVRAGIDTTEYYFTVVQPNPYITEHIRTQRMELAVAEKRYADVERMFATWQAEGLESRPEQKMERLEFLRNYYAGTGQWQKAFETTNKFNTYEDSVRNHALRLSASERQMRYERDSKVLALGKDLEMHKKLRQRNRYLVAAAIAVIVLLIVLIIMMRRMSATREERMLHRIIRLRVEASRARVNPHFIYNVLNHEIAARQKGEGSNMDTIVRLLRRQQYMADEISVPLADDLKFIDDFITVERETIDSPFSYEKKIPESLDTHTVHVPSMILQIFVENAFKHGYSTLPEEAERILRIEASVADGRLEISVLNNSGSPFGAFKKGTHLGLRLVAEMLQILNEKKRRQITYSLSDWTDNPEGCGCRASLSVPLNFNFDIIG